GEGVREEEEEKEEEEEDGRAEAEEDEEEGADMTGEEGGCRQRERERPYRAMPARYGEKRKKMS
ncbi:hypothetical protein HDU67_005848, partial [Dinochytrium kinnereticum]